jgi:hypothetical protein
VRFVFIKELYLIVKITTLEGEREGRKEGRKRKEQ